MTASRLRTSINVDPTIYEQFKRVADFHDRSISQELNRLMREAVIKYRMESSVTKDMEKELRSPERPKRGRPPVPNKKGN
jgi:hypothetical protein